MAVAWSWAFDTPFKWMKQVASHFGGTRQGMAICWPNRIKDAGGIRSQFHHMIDIVPTILEATGIPAPLMVNGIAQKPIEGVSMTYTFDKSSARVPSILNRSYTITAVVDISGSAGSTVGRAGSQDGSEGMIVTEGGRFGGYGLYLLKGKPVFLYNFLDLERFRWEGQDALAPGKHTIVFDFKYDGPGFGKGGTGVLKVDDKEVATRKILHTIPFIIAVEETFDVGVDTRTGVEDKDYQVPFRFTGKLDKLTLKLAPVQLTRDEHQVIRHARAGADN
jgi:Sulfatase